MNGTDSWDSTASSTKRMNCGLIREYNKQTSLWGTWTPETSFRAMAAQSGKWLATGGLRTLHYHV